MEVNSPRKFNTPKVLATGPDSGVVIPPLQVHGLSSSFDIQNPLSKQGQSTLFAPVNPALPPPPPPIVVVEEPEPPVSIQLSS